MGKSLYQKSWPGGAMPSGVQIRPFFYFHFSVVGKRFSLLATILFDRLESGGVELDDARHGDG
jgi:hypothetical protein